MHGTRELTVTLPNDVADEVRARVQSGEYANESEVISEGLRVLQDRDQALEVWLRETALPAYEAYKADPSSALSSDDIRADLAARHERATRQN